MTEVWRTVAARLKTADIPTPELDARLLVGHAAGLSEATALSATRDELAPDALSTLDALVSRRISGEPVSRIIGRRGFWNHEFLISPATLDPRPDSETLIELTLRIVAFESWESLPLRILDLGTGSGCLLLSLLSELPDAVGLGIDISKDALSLAQKNADHIGVAGRATFQQGNWFDGLNETFDIIVSNPPYIVSRELNNLMVEVKQHDPVTALDGGTDGLDAYRIISAQASKYAPNGWLVFECGKGQFSNVSSLMAAGGFTAPMPDLGIAKDLGGVERCVAGRAHNARLRNIA